MNTTQKRKEKALGRVTLLFFSICVGIPNESQPFDEHKQTRRRGKESSIKKQERKSNVIQVPNLIDTTLSRDMTKLHTSLLLFDLKIQRVHCYLHVSMSLSGGFFSFFISESIIWMFAY